MHMLMPMLMLMLMLMLRSRSSKCVVVQVWSSGWLRPVWSSGCGRLGGSGWLRVAPGGSGWLPGVAPGWLEKDHNKPLLQTRCALQYTRTLTADWVALERSKRP